MVIPELMPKDPPKKLVFTLSWDTGSKPVPKLRLPPVFAFRFGKKFPLEISTSF